MNFKGLTVLTNMPSPYQVDLFNVLAGELDIKVVYVKKTEPDRKWNYEKYIKHDHVFLKGPAFKRLVELEKHLKEDRLFIISGYNLPEFLYSMVYLSGRKKTWLFWGEKIRIKKLWLKKFTITQLLKNARAILGIGRLAARLYYEITNVPTFVFPYHVDTSRFNKKSTYCFNNRINFLYSGQLIQRKGIFDILKAFEMIRKDYRDRVFLHIVGDGPLMQTVKNRISDYSNDVQLYGFVSYDELPEIYAKGDVFLFPSLYDGWGVALAEGMAARMAPISTFTTGAATDLILHGYNGFIVPPQNPILLADYMKQLIDEPEKIEKIGDRASEYVREHNDIQKGAQKLIHIISMIK